MGDEPVDGRCLRARLTMLGAVMLTFGASLAGWAESASAATPTISFSPSTPAPPPPATDPVFVSGSGFKASTQGALFECSNDPSQPTIDVTITVGTVAADLGKIPVGCTPAFPFKTNASGKLPGSTYFSIGSGVLGPPVAGTDSAGNPASTDAKAYPCPPTTAQSSDSCELMFVDTAGETAAAPIKFSFQTTTTTTTSTTTTTAPTSSTSTTAPASSPPPESTTNNVVTDAQTAGSGSESATAATSASLAFTGSGTWLWLLCLVGVLFMVLGASFLFLLDTPRRSLRAVVGRVSKWR